MKHLKKIMVMCFSALPHINIALSISLLVLFVTDRYNRAMAFINNDIAKWMLAVLCVSVVISSIWQVVMQRKQAKISLNNHIKGKNYRK